ncbi:MAG: dicarboxylate/amino acid:cation symporter [Planctomycetota bacterium]
MPRLALHWQILIAMLLGAATGVALNASFGRRPLAAPVTHGDGHVDLVDSGDVVRVEAGQFWSDDAPHRTLIQVDEAVDVDDPKLFRTRRIVVGVHAAGEDLQEQVADLWPDLPRQADDAEPALRAVPTLYELAAIDPQAGALFTRYGRSPARLVGDWAQALGDLFLRMLKMVSLPLIITSLITGIVGLGQAERLGRMFGTTLLYYLTTSMLAIVTGLAMVNFLQPGAGADLGQPIDGQQVEQGQSLGGMLFQQLRNMIPTNPFQAAANGDFLSIIAFSLALGVCTILVGGEAAERIGSLIEAAFQVMMKLTLLVIKLAPLGVFFLMLSATATQGAAVFGTLGWYLLTVACALAIHGLIVLPMILHFVARRSPLEYAKAVSPALLTAFSSASSNGTLPLTMTCVEERGGVNNRVGSFVLPLGATINMDGTALYEVVAVLFIAQMSGRDLSLAQQLVVAFTALLASIGAAGIPHAGLVMMVVILQAVGLPTESQGLIIAVDRVLDMCRTAVNVWSDSCGCAVVARYETVGEESLQLVANEGDLAL